MRTISSQPSFETSRKFRLGRLMPALFTRMSTRPWRFSISAPTLTTCALSPTSQASASAFTRFTASFSVLSLRPEITTLAPALTSSWAAERPMPDPPPVIHATRPFNSPACVLLGTEQHLRLFFCEARRGAAPVRKHFEGFLDRRALGHAIAPALDVRKVVDVH